MLNSSIKVGNNIKARFWHERWYNNSPFKDIYPGLFSFTSRKDALISDSRQDHNKFLTFRRNLNDWKLERYPSLLNHLSGSPPTSSAPNSLIWDDQKPEEWRSSTMIPLFKNKGDIHQVTKPYYESLDTVVELRMRRGVPISENQFEFLPGR